MNQLYAKARERALETGLDWTNATINAVLVDVRYSFSSGHQYLNAIDPNYRLALNTVPLSGKHSTDGYADCNPINFVGISYTGYALTYMVLYENTGDPATSRLIAFIDSAAGLPITANGDWTFYPNAAFGGIFRI